MSNRTITFIDYDGNKNNVIVSSGVLCYNAHDKLHHYKPNKLIKTLVIPEYDHNNQLQSDFIELYINDLEIEEVVVEIPIIRLVCQTNDVNITTKHKPIFIHTNSKTFFKNISHITKMFEEIYLKY